MQFVLSPQAEIDLEEIGNYIAQDNPRRAVTFIDEIKAKCKKFGHASSIGTPRPDLGIGIRMLPHGYYLIFYSEHLAVIRIERVMHSSRNIGGEDFGQG